MPHVADFTRAFFGADAADVVPAHAVVLLSYAMWFAAGVIFEQMWRSSATNDPPPAPLSARAGRRDDELALLLDPARGDAQREADLSAERAATGALRAELAAASRAAAELRRRLRWAERAATVAAAAAAAA
eukprot:gene49091-1728_t